MTVPTENTTPPKSTKHIFPRGFVRGREIWAICIHMSIYIHASSQDTQLKLLLRHHVGMTCPHVWHDAFMWICIHASLPRLPLWWMHQVGITQRMPSAYTFIYMYKHIHWEMQRICWKHCFGAHSWFTVYTYIWYIHIYGYSWGHGHFIYIWLLLYMYDIIIYVVIFNSYVMYIYMAILKAIVKLIIHTYGWETPANTTFEAFFVYIVYTYTWPFLGPSSIKFCIHGYYFYIYGLVYTHIYMPTGWRRCRGCLIFIGHLPQKSH